jgi:glycerol-3-phosphate acyltransferase PlsX
VATVALDAMGGDHAPRETIRGALNAAARGVDVVLVGDEAVLGPQLAAHDADLPIVHAAEVIGMDEDPAVAVRSKREASVTVAARLVRSGEAAGMVSAGSTGAALAAAAVIIGRVKGVSRPAIGTILPLGSPTVVLDIGANVEVKAEHLGQFAVMGSTLARVYLDVEEPRVGLLNIGEEAVKGRDLEREAHQLLAGLDGIDFIGNVEGRDIGSAAADVVVTDGFTGNVLLKVAEGTAVFLGREVMTALSTDADDPAYQQALAAVTPRLMAMRNRLDPEAYGGAHLVGAKGTVVIAHGSSTRIAIANALEMAAEGAERGLVSMIEEQIGAG